ncbi:MAG: hypothetical protein BGO68_05915 [Candidatus Amoebophilus sp. 36-38]|nr:MAG: hypothetical protein BGO68_05915 [Candidatus Amoebophilus sp. 36-38]
MDKPNKTANSTVEISHPKRQIFDNRLGQSRLSYLMYQLFDITKKKREFLIIILFLLIISAIITPYPMLARWFGFMLASYSAIANDSIQTIGTFIASNTNKKWWYLWLFIGLIFVGTVTYSWVVYGGDVSYQRLTEKGFSEAPTNFKFLQLFAPIVLLILTHLRIPVSTSFLLLNVFATEPIAIYHVLQKSFYGYIIAFCVAIIFWYAFSKIVGNYFKAKPWKGWIVFQWIVSGLLWSVWIMQDASNIAVFLPRKLNVWELLLFIGFIFFGIGVLFYLRGDKMQKLVNEKSGITDVRAAMLVNLVYMLILFYFKNVNNIPMSTTWVFIGLLGGREIAISFARKNLSKRKKMLQQSIKFIKRDVNHAFIGLLISITLAFLVNSVIRQMILDFLKKFFN